MALTWTSPIDRPIEQRKEVMAYRNSFISVFDDQVAFSGVDNPDSRYLRIVERDGNPGAAILAMCGGLVALVLVYRYPLGRWEWGIPRGFAESADPGETLRIELDGELGGQPRTFTKMMTITPNSGLLAGSTALFHAVYDTPVAAPTDREVREVRWLTVADLAAAIVDGHVQDAFTLSALAAASVQGIIQLPQVTR